MTHVPSGSVATACLTTSLLGGTDRCIGLRHRRANGRSWCVRFRISDTDQGVALLDALSWLCDAPLDHPSIARPLECGVEGNLPWVAYAYLEGPSLHDYLKREGAQWLSELVRSVTQAAAGIDFAAAAGVHHGAMGHGDLIAGPEATGVCGLGLVQALIRAGIPAKARAPHASPHRQAGATPALSDDVYALAALTFDLLASRAVATCSSLYEGADPVRLTRVFRQALAKQPEERTGTALEFAAALQDGIAAPVQGTPLVPARPVEPAAAAPGDAVTSDPLRAEPRIDDPVAFFTADRFDPIPSEPSEPFSIMPFGPAGTFERGWLLVAAALVVGVLIGLAGGFAAGQRAASSMPGPPAGVKTISSSPASEPRPERPDRPWLADAAVIPDAGARERAGQKAQTTGAPREQSRAPTASASSAPGLGSLQVESRPAGAQVFLDERAVGSTPALIPNVTAGDHRVRIELPGYRSWVTSVSVGASSRARVGASLEQ